MRFPKIRAKFVRNLRVVRFCAISENARNLRKRANFRSSGFRIFEPLYLISGALYLISGPLYLISGPLYLVARYLGDMADGLHPDLRPLRKRDELQGFFSAFEDATTFLRKRDQELLAYVEECLAAVKSAQDGNADQLKGALELLEKKRDTFHQSLSVSDLQDEN